MLLCVKAALAAGTPAPGSALRMPMDKARSPSRPLLAHTVTPSPGQWPSALAAWWKPLGTFPCPCPNEAHRQPSAPGTFQSTMCSRLETLPRAPSPSSSVPPHMTGVSDPSLALCILLIHQNPPGNVAPRVNLAGVDWAEPSHAAVRGLLASQGPRGAPGTGAGWLCQLRPLRRAPRSTFVHLVC